MFRSFTLCLLIGLALTGCGTIPLHNTPPEAQASRAVVSGFTPNIRAWGDIAPGNLDAVVSKRIAEYKLSHAEYFRAHGVYPPMDYLALSGGGNDGAFGAGILCGWSASGKRPDFTIVTGISTGALIAPFAFLGPDYDDELRQVYTTLSSENIFIGTLSTVFDGLTGGMALTDNGPLAKKIEESITQEMFTRIGAEHRKGRRLLIGTTNIEAQRSVIWDIGSLANSGSPGGLKLFREILLASAAIPGAFKPVFIDVTIDGKNYSEIHADGGVTAQVFLYPLQSTSRESALFKESGIDRHLYVIRNTKITPEYRQLKPSVVSLSQRSIETLIKYQGIGDLFKLYVGAQRDGIAYNLIQVPPEFTAESKQLFDPAYMTKIFDLGYRMGADGIPWQTKPPGAAYIDEVPISKN